MNPIHHFASCSNGYSNITGITDFPTTNAQKALTNADYYDSLDYRNSLGGAI